MTLFMLNTVYQRKGTGTRDQGTGFMFVNVANFFILP
jgi:hypothetical protein